MNISIEPIVNEQKSVHIYPLAKNGYMFPYSHLCSDFIKIAIHPYKTGWN